MVAVGHCFVAATFAVDVRGVVMPAMMRKTIGGVRCGYFNDMFVKVVAMGAVQVAVVQIIGMIAVADGRVSAAVAVDVGVQFMEFVMMAHDNAFYNKSNTPINGQYKRNLSNSGHGLR